MCIVALLACIHGGFPLPTIHGFEVFWFFVVDEHDGTRNKLPPRGTEDPQHQHLPSPIRSQSIETIFFEKVLTYPQMFKSSVSEMILDDLPSTNPRRPPMPTMRSTLQSVGSLLLLLVSVLVVMNRESIISSVERSHDEATFGTTVISPRRRLLESTTTTVKVYYDATATSSILFRKFHQDVTAAGSLIEMAPLDVNAPTACPTAASERIQELLQADQYHLALEVLKYCAVAHGGGSGLFLDAGASVMVDTLVRVLQGYGDKNLAVFNDPFLPSSIHGGLLFFHPKNSAINAVMASQMLELLVSTKLEALVSNPTLLPKSLYDLLAAESNLSQLAVGASDRWYFFQHSCIIEPLGGRQATAPISAFALQSYRLTQNCPEPSGFCCSIVDPIEHIPIMMTKHLLLPYQVLPDVNHLPKPLNAEAGHFDPDELPYISTITEVVHQLPEGQSKLTPNFFDILLQNDCLPSDRECSDCLRDKKGSNCQKCASVCSCYCKTLCNIPVEEKFISKSLTVRPPLYARDPSRLIPRIVHQTWFEDVTPEKYPNMSRLIESFKQSGWDYRFYTDDESVNFLSTHFPPEVREAYFALRPGAFKADLFRYCVLLIHGGVYADMDILLETNLDLAVANDIGFMVPQDEPGTPVNHRHCLWNGFIAVAPGHPFLAKVIQSVVNNVRNRFTSVDNDHLFCPIQEMSILHAFDTLFTAGPCILGASINQVLGRHGQTPFQAGELDIWEASKKEATLKGTGFVIGADDKPSSRIPGKTIILHQNKWDMGAHRFTDVDRNLVVAATDLPDADDRANQEKTVEHYSKTHVKAGIYGLDKLYTDNNKANEELRFYVDAQWKLQTAKLTGGAAAQQ